MTKDQKLALGEATFVTLVELARSIGALDPIAIEAALVYLDHRLTVRCDNPECDGCAARPYFHPVGLELIHIIQEFTKAVKENEVNLEEASHRFKTENPQFVHTPTPLQELVTELMEGRTPQQVRRQRRGEGRFVSPEELLGILLNKN